MLHYHTWNRHPTKDSNEMYRIYSTLNHHYIRPHMEHFTLESQSVFLICFEAWANWIDNRLVCVPLGIHLELINKQLMLLVIIIIIIINSTIWPKERIALPTLQANHVPYELIKSLVTILIITPI